MEATEAGRRLPLGGAKQRALLALLLLHANEVVSSERLVDALWNGAGAREGAKSLSVAVSRLRKTLALGQSRDGEAGVVVTRPPGYELRLDPDRLDLHRFEQLLAEARSATEPTATASKLRDALALWRGAPLADLAYESFCQAEITRLEELRLTAIEERLRADLELGRHLECVGELEQLVAQHPLRERSRGLLMLALYRSGRQAEALDAYLAARAALTGELGIEPSRDLQELQQAILSQDPNLDLAQRGGDLRGLSRAAETTNLEREEELASLERALEEARSGRGALTLIEGPAGIGKTRLLELAREQAEAAGMTVLTARGAELERDFAFGAVRRLFERAATPGSEEQRRALTAGAARLAAPVLDYGSVSAEDLDPTYAVLHGLYWLTANLAEQAPLLIAVDDLQWVDDPSLRFLLHLARRLDGLPIALLVCRRRDGESEGVGLDDELALELRGAPIRPAPLGVDAAARMLAGELGEQPPVELAQACREVTGGNPFLLRELIAELRSQGAALSDLPLAEVRRLGPERIATALLLRIGRIHPSAPSLAQALATLGDSAPVGVAARLAGLDTRTANDLWRSLTEASVLADPGGSRFVHPIVRAAIYEDLPLSRRAALHAEAAALLREAGAPDDEVAAHVMASDPGSIDGAATTLSSAAATAMRRGAPDSAARLLERALVEEIDDRERVRALAVLGEAEHELGLGSAPRRYLAAIELSEDPLERARLANALAWATGPIPDAQLRQLPLYERAATDAEEDEELAATLEAARLFVLDLNQAREAELETRRHVDLEGKTPAERLLLAIAARFTMMSDGAEAVTVADLARRAAAAPLMIRSAPQPAWLIHVADTLNATESWELGEQLLTGIISEAERGGSVLGFARASYFRAVIRHTRGDLRPAEEDAQAALEATIEESIPGLWKLRPIIEILADTGRVSEGEELLERYGFAGEIAPIRPLTPILIARGRMRIGAGDLAGGRADLEAALERMAAGRSRGPVGLDAKLALSLVLHRTGEEERARKLSREALAAARCWGTSRSLGGALRVAGLVSEDAGKRLRLLRESAQAFEDSPALLWRAETLVDLGAALSAGGEGAEARKALAQALDLADRAGANPLAERAEAELSRAGAQPRRRALTGIASLTASERRVAGMAAAGQSNKEIAQALFVTLRTVEMHLSRTYAKLGISSRRELPQALAGEGDEPRT